VPSESGSAGPVQSYHNCSANDSVWCVPSPVRRLHVPLM
jgi:hypothetical protein